MTRTLGVKAEAFAFPKTSLGLGLPSFREGEKNIFRPHYLIHKSVAVGVERNDIAECLCWLSPAFLCKLGCVTSEKEGGERESVVVEVCQTKKVSLSHSRSLVRKPFSLSLSLSLFALHSFLSFSLHARKKIVDAPVPFRRRRHERVIELLPLRALETSVDLLARAASPSEVDAWLFSRFFPATNCDPTGPGRKRRQRRRPRRLARAD